jgi:hypothetical protein
MNLVQICASNNDLFGLDRDGAVYQYNFSTNTWRKLGEGWSGGDSADTAGDQQTTAAAKSRRGGPRSAN